MEVAGAPGLVLSPQSEAVTSELQELSLQPAPNPLPLQERKNVLQLKLQQRRTREELVSQGIMPPLKSPAAFHEQRRSLERARTEDYLKRKIRSRPERSELVRMHILEVSSTETSAEPSLQAKQLQLKRARLADDLNDKISHRPGPIELVHKNILSVNCPVHSPLDSPKGAGGESSSLDEDSSDALSPDQLINHDSPLSAVPQLSPPDVLTQNGDMSPPQFITQSPPPPPPPPPPQVNGSDFSPLPKVTNGTTVTSANSRPSTGHMKQSQAKSSSDRPPQRPKKPKDSKPKVKKLKYHQYIPPDQKADKERPPQMDSSYAKLLHQQQLFLQLQILNQQQQHYNYHTILPAPPKPPTEQPPTTNSGPSPSRSVPATTTPAPSNQSGTARQSQTAMGGAKPTTLPANLDEFKVAELKQELKLRGLTVSGTKNDLIERLRNYQEQNGGTTVVLKNGTSQPSHHGMTSAASTITSSPTTTTTPDHQSGEGMFKLALSSLAQVVPGRVMRFGSTSSSPPVSPTPSERSLAGMSPDETSCNGDMFGEMVSSPLTQLTLHPSPQHPSNLSPRSQPLSKVKEEIQSSCSLSRPSPGSCQPPEPLPGVAMDTSSLDKDQMLQEKDKQIEELTRMLRQKQRLVETLRSQLEQGKVAGGIVLEKDGSEKSRTSPEVKLQTLIKASAIQPPTLPNGIVVKVKKEVEPEEGMEGITEEVQAKKPAKPMQCSQETLLRLQQIHRLQVQHAEQQKQTLQHSQVQLQKVAEAKSNPQKLQQQKKEAQILLQQQQQLQQLIIQQTQQKQLQAQQKLAQQKLAQQKLSQQKVVQQNQLKQTQGQVQQSQQKNPVQLKQVQVQIQKPAVNQTQQRRQLKAQQRQQQRQQAAAVTTQQVAPVFVNQQNGTQIHTQAISLDLLKANGTPTLVTDSNGNHYLIALTNHTTDGQNGVSSLAKTNGRITLQRLQSTPSKLPSTDSQLKEQPEAEPVSQPIKKGQKAGLHLDTNGVPQPSLSVTAPPNLQPFFDDMSDSESQSNLISSLKREEVCPPYDRHTLFTPPSPKPNTSLPTQRSKQENGVNSQQMDDLFDILLKSGEIPGFKANPDPSLAPLHSDPPSPSSPPSPLHLSPPTPTEPLISPQPSVGESCTGSGRLEDFLESTTGAPLLGVEPDGGLTLIDDLHSQMLSTPSILDHPPSPMDTSDLGFSPHSSGLDFGDPTLDSMDWLDISMVGSTSGGSGGSGGGRGGGGGGAGDGGTSLAPLAPHTPQSVFSADFLDSTDLQLHWESCL
ncbi:myocardin related transcription factor Ab isoform X5 [Siniperca chuatsi]|uniref:myocardin related transcription factor Ab isoform X5 n=1 Tax=Siniperca chuatsi TaxID=119488 RepID=UPI001CE13A89|nr:myocardin related transcription factor Ab isoform X5 [Siniperca chuatsi]XP_044035206.1 myocardin related transcription factor Ab isoform X5 [Siniperca chuatsi]XP_044035207.1 myocardin related transcription factor Ab isoform X5 [Siniperca chuatsi]XP_044035208.1 myocardin related transcription factor Ab isoform X5 [Siniperca chuatsi]